MPKTANKDKSRNPMTQNQAMEMFSNKTFSFARTQLEARNFIADIQNDVTVEIFDENEDDWMPVTMTLKTFFKDKPELIK